VSQASRRQFQSSRKILRNFQLSKSQIPCSQPNGTVKHPNVLLCQEDSASLASIRPDDRATSSGRSLVFKNTDWKDSLQIRIGKIACNRPNTALIRKRVKHIMERRLHSSPSRRGLEKSEPDSI